MEWKGMENGMEWKENFGMEYGRCSEWNGGFKKWNGRSSSLLTAYIQTCNKLQSNTIDTAYQYEYVSMVISQCIHILLRLTIEPFAVLNIRNENPNYVIINKVL